MELTKDIRLGKILAKYLNDNVYIATYKEIIYRCSLESRYASECGIDDIAWCKQIIENTKWFMKNKWEGDAKLAAQKQIDNLNDLIYLIKVYSEKNKCKIYPTELKERGTRGSETWGNF